MCNTGLIKGRYGQNDEARNNVRSTGAYVDAVGIRLIATLLLVGLLLIHLLSLGRKKSYAPDSIDVGSTGAYEKVVASNLVKLVMLGLLVLMRMLG